MRGNIFSKHLLFKKMPMFCNVQYLINGKLQHLRNLCYNHKKHKNETLKITNLQIIIGIKTILIFLISNTHCLNNGKL